MHVLNFAHPLTEEQLAQLEQIVGEKPQEITDVAVQLDVTQPFVEQVVSLIDGLNISGETWQKTSWLIVLPSLNYIAAICLAELHGRMGHFPTILRLRPKVDSLITSYEIAEIINLEHVRQEARKRRV